jgi:Polyketide cyclase / dehydrase and lipid transport
MKQVETRVTTPRSPHDVYAYLVDFTNQREWRFDVLDSELISGEAGRPGARYRQRVKPGRKEMQSEVELTEAEPHSSVGFRTVDDGPVTVSGVWRIQPQGDGTRVDAQIAIQPNGFLKLFEPMMGPSLRKTGARYETALAECLDGKAGK